MNTAMTEQLAAKKCSACGGNVPKLSQGEIQAHLQAVDGWQVTNDGLRIRKDWHMKDFMAAMKFFDSVAKVAEGEGHHPDMHLEEFRHVWIEIWTHSIGGLSENDFILAAKIDQLPVKLKKPNDQP